MTRSISRIPRRQARNKIRRRRASSPALETAEPVIGFLLKVSGEDRRLEPRAGLIAARLIERKSRMFWKVRRKPAVGA
jgi:hypothetical protein